MAQKIELRRRNGNFTGNDNLMLPVTHVKAVLGLLDEYDKLNTSLLPDSMLNTKRFAGSINNDKTFGSLYTEIKTFNNSKETMYPGTYFISNGKRTIASSTDHFIYYNDDGLNPATSVELEHGDHLFYIKVNTERAWDNTGVTVNVIQGDGIADLSAPYNTILGEHVFATEQDALAETPATGGLNALITGYKWSPSNEAEYNNTGHQINKTVSAGEPMVERTANRLVIPCEDLWDHGNASVGLKLEYAELGSSYFKLTKIDATTEVKIYESIAYANQHMWGVVNNTYGLATTTSSGLMSASDKYKLNGLTNYEHPEYIGRSLDATGVEVISGFTSDIWGHVTNVSKRTLPNATILNPGVVQFADSAASQQATDGSTALTPGGGLSLLRYRQAVSYFVNETTANAANLPDGALAIIPKGDITIT